MRYEESHLGRLRRLIEEQYTGVYLGGFGEILCHELHNGNIHFKALANKWGISLTTLGELIWDHCKRLEGDPKVKHKATK